MYHSLPELVGPAHGDVPLHGDGQGHIDRGAERDGRHRVQEIDIPFIRSNFELTYYYGLFSNSQLREEG